MAQRKRACSLAVVFAFVFAFLFSPAALASRVEVLAVPKVAGDTVSSLGTVFIEITAGALRGGDTAIISLPQDFKFCSSPNRGVTQNNWSSSVVGDTYRVGNSYNYFEIPPSYKGNDNGLYYKDSLRVTPVGDREIKLQIQGTPGQGDNCYLWLHLGAIYIDDSSEGDIYLGTGAPSGSGFSFMAGTGAVVGKNVDNPARDQMKNIYYQGTLEVTPDEQNNFIIYKEPLEYAAKMKNTVSIEAAQAGAGVLCAPEALLVEQLAGAGQDAFLEICVTRKNAAGVDFDVVGGQYDVLSVYHFGMNVKNEPGHKGTAVDKLNGVAEITLDLSKNPDMEKLNGVMPGVFSRLPGGTWEEVRAVYDPEAQTLTFETGAFSLFVVATELRGAKEQKTIVLTTGNSQAAINDTLYLLDAAPYIAGGRVMVPLRFIGETLGAEVGWDAEKRQVRIKSGERTVILSPGSREALVDGVKSMVDSAPELAISGRIFVPLRFVSELLGAIVDYDSGSRRITISKV